MILDPLYLASQMQPRQTSVTGSASRTSAAENLFKDMVRRRFIDVRGVLTQHLDI